METDEPGAVALTPRGSCNGAASPGGIVGFGVVGRDAINLTVDHEIERMNGGFVCAGGARVLEVRYGLPSASSEEAGSFLHPRSVNDLCDRSDR